jgi:uncharacterized protein DUF4340
MKPRTIIFLVSLLVLCVAYVALRKRGEVIEPSGPVTGKVFPDLKEDAQRLELASDAGREIVFEKVDDRWRIVRPIEAEALSYPVNRLVDMLRDMEYARSLDSDQEEASADVTSLDSPRWTVTLTDRAGGKHVLEVGADLPTIGATRPSAYVRAGGGTYVVRENFGEQLGRSVKAYRSKEILDLDPEKVQRVSIVSGSRVSMERRGGVWKLTAPVSARAEQQSVTDIVGNVTHLTALSFVADEAKSLAPYGLDQPTVLVEVEVQSEGPPAPEGASQPSSPPTPPQVHTLALGRKSDGGAKVFARLGDSNSVFTLRGSLLEDLQPKLLDLRDRKLLDFDPTRVVGIEIDRADQHVALIKDDDRWSFRSTPEGPGGEQEVQRFLEGILALSAADFVDDSRPPASLGLDEPAARISLTMEAQGRTLGLLIGGRTPSGDMVFAKVVGRTAIAILPAESIDKLLLDPASLREPTLLSLGDGERVDRLSVQVRERPFVSVVRGDQGAWKLKEPLDAPADLEHVRSILDRLEKLTATTVVHAGPTLPALYAASGAISVEVETSVSPESPPIATTAPDEAEPTSASKPARLPGRTLHLYVGRIDDHAYGWLDGGDVVTVGEFESGLYDDLSAELRDRRLWSIVPQDVGEIRIRRQEGDGAGLELIRGGEEWKWPAGPYVHMDSSKVIDFLRELDELKAEQFVMHKSAEGERFGLNEPWLAVELTETQRVRRLVVGSQASTGSGARYAMVDGLEGVFLLSEDDVKKLDKEPSAFRKPQ